MAETGQAGQADGEMSKWLPDDRYRLERPLGKGWLAVHAATGSRMVLKPKSGFEDVRVARHLMRLRHPALPRILDEIEFGAPGAAEPHLVCEYLEGMTFSEWLNKAGGRLAPEEAVPYLAKAARVLSFLHEQNDPPLLHLDLKPEHLVRLPDNQVGLIDFDCARILPLEPVVRTTIRCTSGYAAPELMTGQPGQACDIYAFGVIMLVLMTGRRFNDSTLPALEPMCRHLPPALTSIIADCIGTSPECRFSSAAALACALERLVAQRGLLRQNASSIPETAAGPAGSSIPEPDNDAVSSRHGPTVADATDDSTAAGSGLTGAAETGRMSGRKSPVRDQLVVIWDNAAFAADFARRLARTGHETIIIDADLLNPRLDLLLGVEGGDALSPGPADDSGQTVHPGLELALTALMRQTLPPEHFPTLLQKTAQPSLKALTGAYQLRDYAFYEARTLLHLYRLCRMHADAVVVSCSRFLHDSFSCLSLLAADLILVPIRAEPPEIREFNRYLDFLVAQYPFERRKARFVAIEYNPARHLGWGMADTLCGGLLAGCIPEEARPPGRERGKGTHLRLWRPSGMADEMEQLLRRLGFTTSPQTQPQRSCRVPGSKPGRNASRQDPARKLMAFAARRGRNELESEEPACP